MTVDGATRHALLDDARLRLYTLEGAEAMQLDLAACAVDVRGNGQFFRVVDRRGGASLKCAGRDTADTQHWLRAIVLACDADAADVHRFSDDDDDSDAGAERKSEFLGAQ